MNAVFAIETGAWSGPVRSPYGLHLVRVDLILHEQLPPLDEVRPRAAQLALEERGKLRLAAGLERLARLYPVRLGSVRRVGRPVDRGDDIVERIQSFVVDHLAEDLRVEALAKTFHMSPRNFSRVFTRKLGVTPGRYVEQCRLERARQLLEGTDASLGEIAETCGYTTPDGLRLAFDRNLGMSPRAYRQSFA